MCSLMKSKPSICPPKKAQRRSTTRRDRAVRVGPWCWSLSPGVAGPALGPTLRYQRDIPLKVKRPEREADQLLATSAKVKNVRS
jgi:hypothetical protein